MEAREFTTSWSAFLLGSSKTSTNTVLLILTLKPAGKIGGKNNAVMYNFSVKKLPKTQRDRGQACRMLKSLVHSRPKAGHLVSSSIVKSSLNVRAHFFK